MKDMKNPSQQNRISFSDPLISHDEVEFLVHILIKLCGYGRVLEIGQVGILLRSLCGMGLDAYAMSVSDDPATIRDTMDTNRIKEGSLLHLPWDDNHFQTIVCLHALDGLSDSELIRAIDEMYRVSNRFVLCRVFAEPTNDETSEQKVTKNRGWWESRFFERGFRKHPLTLTVLSYEGMEYESGSILLILEKIPKNAKDKYPLSVLREERDLHMDMLRESGRRSDAHIIRYTKVLPYIRSNDKVLDIACGMGYGTAIIWDGSYASTVIGVDSSEFSIAYNQENYAPNRPGVRFIHGDAHHLNMFEPNSFDLIVSMETIEHLEKPDVFLEQAKKILKPGGRIIVSIPNEWINEHGVDPNPYHKHVFNLKKIVDLLSKYFEIEQIFGQIAGGGMKLTHCSREWFEITLSDESSAEEAEWWIVVAMKNPITSEVHYQETVINRRETAIKEGPYDFGAAYEFPWIQHALVSVGIRAQSPQLLRNLSEKVINNASSSHGADYGAALCVRGYQILSDQSADTIERSLMISRLKTYVQQDPQTPMQVRWLISCSYLLAQLLFQTGQREEAEKYLLKCLEIDFLRYSPTLATKTVSAALQIGILRYAEGLVDEARKWWQQAIQIAESAFSVPWSKWYGDLDEPLTFGLKEASQVLDIASQATYALSLTAEGKPDRIRIIQDIIDFSNEKHRQWLLKRENILLSELKKALKQKSLYEEQLKINQSQQEKINLLHQELVHRDNMINELKDWIEKLEQGKRYLERKWSETIKELDRREHSINELKDWNDNLQEGKRWLEEKLDELTVELDRREQFINELKDWNDNLQEGKRWLEEKLNELTVELDRREQSINELKQWINSLEESKKWLEERLNEKKSGN